MTFIQVWQVRWFANIWNEYRGAWIMAPAQTDFDILSNVTIQDYLNFPRHKSRSIYKYIYVYIMVAQVNTLGSNLIAMKSTLIAMKWPYTWIQITSFIYDFILCNSSTRSTSPARERQSSCLGRWHCVWSGCPKAATSERLEKLVFSSEIIMGYYGEKAKIMVFYLVEMGMYRLWIGDWCQWSWELLKLWSDG